MDRRRLLQLGALAGAATFVPNFTQSAPTTIFSKKASLESDRIRLNANENVYGPSGIARQAVSNALDQANRYPLVDALPSLRKAIAAFHQVEKEMVMITAGSYQGLRVIGTRLSNGKGNHIAPDLSFTAIMRQSELMGCEWKKVPVLADKGINLKGMKDAIDSDTQFVYITNPNNPTGHYIDSKKIEKFCREVGKDKPIVLDEAYIEFVNGDNSASLVKLVKEIPNLVVVRTFSKIYGLAGLRIGYTIAKKEWIKDWMDWEQTGGVGVSNVSAMAALASLKDQEFVKSSKTKISNTRNQFVASLEDLGIKVYESKTNFILAESSSYEKKLMPLLENAKIDIGIGRPGVMKGLTRISIGTPEQMNELLKLIKESVV